MLKLDFNAAADEYCAELESKKDGFILFPDWLKEKGIELDIEEDEIDEYPKIYKPVTNELFGKFLMKLFSSRYVENEYECYLGYLMPNTLQSEVIAEIMTDNNPYTIDINAFYDFDCLGIEEILLFIKLCIDDERFKFSYEILEKGNVWIEVKVFKEISNCTLVSLKQKDYVTSKNRRAKEEGA